METDSMTVLSKAQKGVYLETTAFPDRTTYNLPYLCELKKNVDIKKLKKAIELLISIHPCLNSEIVSDETGEIYMKTPAGANVLEYRMSDSEFEERQKRLVRPFRMNGECLSRFEIYLTESAEYLFYDFHHVAADGYSLKLFKDELLAAYNGQSIAREKYTACEYAEEEQSLIGEEAYTETQQYWAELLAPFDTDCLPPADNKLEKPVQKWYEKEFLLIWRTLMPFAAEQELQPQRCSLQHLVLSLPNIMVQTHLSSALFFPAGMTVELQIQ